MLPSIPDIRDYSISPEHGFLPDEPPLERLPDPYYEPWEAVISSLQALILAKRVRREVDNLPTLTTSRLSTAAEWRRAYLILGFIAHSYIWGGEVPKDRLPQCISIPFLRISEQLEIPPVATYAAVCLWNFKAIYADEPIDSLENLMTLSTFTGSLDESWFYLVSVAIEARGAPTIPVMLEAIAAARNDDSLTVTECLSIFAERIEELRDLLGRMYENCSPHSFYFRIRPFLAGSKNMAEAGLPHGVLYEDGSGTEVYRQYSGGSNAQSSLIQTFDIILGVEHRPTGVKRNPTTEKQEGTSPAPKHNFIQEMRSYMPGPHRRFLEHLTSVANIREYVESHRDNKALSIAFDDCLKALASFRDKHLQIVSRYIVVQSQEAKRKAAAAAAAAVALPQQSTTPVDRPANAYGLAKGNASKQGLKGTGGTKLMPFLKQSRDETIEPAIGGWGKMSKFDSFRARTPIPRTPIPRPRSTDFTGTCKVNEFEDVPAIVGLAGAWDESDDVGGLCSY